MCPTRRATSSTIYQVKISLWGSRPPVWRSVQVCADITLARLHPVIQEAMGWQDYHLHMFTVGGKQYGVPSPEDWTPVYDERRVRLNRFLKNVGDKLSYEYDFGDTWIHELQVEEILPAKEGVRYPICVAGRWSCPPEDVGGIGGYVGFLDALADPEHPEHFDYLEWIGGAFDPDAFDLDRANLALRAVR